MHYLNAEAYHIGQELKDFDKANKSDMYQTYNG
jgi:hypothetical protein